MERACPCCSKGYLETEWQAVMFPARSVGSVGIEEARGFTLGEVVRTRSGGMCAQLRYSPRGRAAVHERHCRAWHSFAAQVLRSLVTAPGCALGNKNRL